MLATSGHAAQYRQELKLSACIVIVIGLDRIELLFGANNDARHISENVGRLTDGTCGFLLSGLGRRLVGLNLLEQVFYFCRALMQPLLDVVLGFLGIDIDGVAVVAWRGR